MRLNLILGFVWLLIGAPLVLVNATSIRIPDVPRSDNSLMIGLLAMLLSLYNFARWYASRALSRRRRDAAPPPEKKRVDRPTLEYHPEFDFGRQGPQTLKTDDDPKT